MFTEYWCRLLHWKSKKMTVSLLQKQLPVYKGLIHHDSILVFLSQICMLSSTAWTLLSRYEQNHYRHDVTHRAGDYEIEGVVQMRPILGCPLMSISVLVFWTENVLFVVNEV